MSGHTLDLVLSSAFNVEHVDLYEASRCVSDHKAITFNCLLTHVSPSVPTSTSARVFNIKTIQTALIKVTKDFLIAADSAPFQSF